MGKLALVNRIELPLGSGCLGSSRVGCPYSASHGIELLPVGRVVLHRILDGRRYVMLHTCRVGKSLTGGNGDAIQSQSLGKSLGKVWAPQKFCRSRSASITHSSTSSHCIPP